MADGYLRSFALVVVSSMQLGLQAGTSAFLVSFSAN